MAGIIGNLFQPDQQSDHTHATDLSTGSDTAVALSPEATIELGGTYQGLDGSTTAWSSSTTVELDVGANLHHSASSSFDDGSA